MIKKEGIKDYFIVFICLWCKTHNITTLDDKVTCIDKDDKPDDKVTCIDKDDKPDDKVTCIDKDKHYRVSPIGKILMPRIRYSLTFDYNGNIIEVYDNVTYYEKCEIGKEYNANIEVITSIITDQVTYDIKDINFD